MGNKEYQLTKWNIICRPEDKGVLVLRYWTSKIGVFFASGFTNYFRMKEFGKNYLQTNTLVEKTLCQVQAKPTDSPFWKGIMGVKDDFLQRVLSLLVMA
jgi:hypothetical protein